MTAPRRSSDCPAPAPGAFRRSDALRIPLIASMMAAIALSAGQLASRVFPGFDPALLALMAFLAGLEGIAGDRLARQFPEASIRLRLHFSEWVVLLAALRLVLSLSQGPEAFAAQAIGWWAHPHTLLDGGLVAAGVLLATVWWLGIQMSRCLEALGPEADTPPPNDSAAFYAWLTRPLEDRPGEARERLSRLIFAGGTLLLLMSGLARLDLQLALSLRHPAVAGIVGNALLYFLLGFVLLAQGHYASLQARWQRQQVPVGKVLGRRWAVLGIVFALGVALLALLLPVRPSLALFGAAFRAIWGLFVVVGQAGLAAVAAVAYLLEMLLRLLRLFPATESAAPPPPAMPAPQPVPQAPPTGWWEAIQGLVLWAVLAAVVVYGATRFVRERRGLWGMLVAQGGPLAWLARLAAAAGRRLAGLRRAAAARWRGVAERARVPGHAAALRPRLRWLRPRTLREHVWLLYLQTLQETARAGHPRAPADTPYEYARRAAPQLPEASEELQRMTEAFVSARYGPHDPAPADLAPLRAAYRRLRRACRHLLAAGRDSG